MKKIFNDIKVNIALVIVIILMELFSSLFGNKLVPFNIFRWGFIMILLVSLISDIKDIR